jgi:ABC-type transporter Mla MlaB component
MEDTAMLKISNHDDEATTFKLDGELAGSVVKRLECSWRMALDQGRGVMIDLTNVTFIDSEGKDLLVRMLGIDLSSAEQKRSFQSLFDGLYGKTEVPLAAAVGHSSNFAQLWRKESLFFIFALAVILAFTNFVIN